MILSSVDSVLSVAEGSIFWYRHDVVWWDFFEVRYPFSYRYCRCQSHSTYLSSSYGCIEYGGSRLAVWNWSIVITGLGTKRLFEIRLPIGDRSPLKSSVSIERNRFYFRLYYRGVWRYRWEGTVQYFFPIHTIPRFQAPRRKAEDIPGLDIQVFLLTRQEALPLHYLSQLLGACRMTPTGKIFWFWLLLLFLHLP